MIYTISHLLQQIERVVIVAMLYGERIKLQYSNAV